MTDPITTAEVDYQVHFLSAGVHSGAGTGGARADRRVLREGGDLLIPGSHLRGVIRHRMEQLARALGETVAEPHALDPGQAPDAADPVTRVFGAGERDTVTVFHDLRPRQRSGPTSLRRRVSIDRRRRSQRPLRLFDMEVWEQDRLDGRIIAHLEQPAHARRDLALLVAALRLVDAIGGSRSAGFGRCRIEIERVAVDGQAQELRALFAALDDGSPE